jgi:hypothetical protein
MNQEGQRMVDTAPFGRTLSFSGCLLACLETLFPVFIDYRYFNGLETVLFFINRDETIPTGALLASSLAASLLGLILVLRRIRWIGCAVPVFIASLAGIWLGLLLNFRFAFFGWVYLSGLILQVAGCAAYALASLGRSG